MEQFDVKKEFNSKYEEARARFGKRPKRGESLSRFLGCFIEVFAENLLFPL